MAKYMTKQRKLLLDYLSEHADETLPTSRLVTDLSEKGISASAIYRNLADLEQDGKVKRSTKPGSQELYYRYVGMESCRDHLHRGFLGIGTPPIPTYVEIDNIIFLDICQYCLYLAVNALDR